MRRLGIGLGILAWAGCAKHAEYQSAMVPSRDYAETGGAVYEEADDEYRAGKADFGPPPPPPPPPPAAAPILAEMPPQEPRPSPAPQPAAQRMVHYSGWARMVATDVDVTIDAIEKLALDAGGKVERRSSADITIRVPVARFDEIWASVLGLGDVASRSVSAEDVTDAFLAVDLRVQTLKATKDRLVALLAKSTDEHEKLQLIAEIGRVTEELDQFEAQLQTLRSLADFSRISVQVDQRQAFAQNQSQPEIQGFEWIRAISPFRHDVGTDRKRLELPVPDGMVQLSQKGPYAAESPEGASVWTGRLLNEPIGDAAYWAESVRGRLSGEFASAGVRPVGAWQCVRFVETADAPYTWDVCVQPKGKDLLLFEAFFPTPDALARYGAAVEQTLSVGGAS